MMGIVGRRNALVMFACSVILASRPLGFEYGFKFFAQVSIYHSRAVCSKHSWWKLKDTRHQIHTGRFDLETESWTLGFLLQPLPKKSTNACFVRSLIRAKTSIPMNP